MLHTGSGQLACLAEPVLKTVLRNPDLQETWLAGAALLATTSNVERAMLDSILGLQ